MNIQHEVDIASTCPQMTMTMKPDITGRPFLYVAQKEAGLCIYDITSISSPALIQTIPIDSLDSLHVMNLSQEGNYLYLALGNHFSNSQSPGMAIIDVSNPAVAFVKSVWKSSATDGGAGIVKTENNYAYLGAMTHGLMILDISDKTNIQLVSQFMPDLSYPTGNPDTAKYNARGMAVKNDIVYLCFDAGGIRIINTQNKLNPVETGRFSNPVLNNLPRAYNNIVLDDTLAYVTVDYCGMEVLNLADTSNIRLVSWWNPWDCQSNSLNWFSSPGHANELEYNKNCKQLFIASGKSDLHVVDVTNPLQPDSCNFYGGVSNGMGTWGVGLYHEKIFLSYVCAIIPFSSNWTGVKILTYTPCLTGVKDSYPDEDILLYPSPASDEVRIENKSAAATKIEIYNALGKLCCQSDAGKPVSIINIKHLPPGVYFVFLEGSKRWIKKFIKE